MDARVVLLRDGDMTVFKSEQSTVILHKHLFIERAQLEAPSF